MPPRVRAAALAGSAYTALFLALTVLVPAPSSPVLRLTLGYLFLFLPTLAALVATVRAARASLGTERAFWSLLAAASAAQMAAEAALLAHAVLRPELPGLLGLGHVGHYTFSVFVAISIFVSPHRPPATGRTRAAWLEWTMAAAAVYFLVFYFAAVPLGDRAAPWIFTGQQVALAAGFAVLAFIVRTPPLAAVYRVLAVGLGLAAVARCVPIWREGGPYDPYSAANADWVITLLALATAAAADRGRAWVAGPDEGEGAPRRGWLMAAAVMLPLVVDLATRALGGEPAAAEERSVVALAMTGVLLALMAVSVRRTSSIRSDTEPSWSAGSIEESSGYVHFATGVAHELNNPLMAVGVWAELALRNSAPRESLAALLAATQRATLAARRLQQLGRAAEPPDAAGGGAAAPGVQARRHPEPPAETTRAARGPSVRRVVLATALFAAVYFLAAEAKMPAAATDGLLVLPSAMAAAVLWRRARESRAPRQAWFWRLLAAGPALWAVAEMVWTGLEMAGRSPGTAPTRLLDTLFLAFPVPVAAALGLRAHPRIVRRDPAALPDLVVIGAAVVYTFVRLGVTAALPMTEPLATKRILLGAFCAAAGFWAAALWRTVDQPAWRSTYGAISIFALSYGVLGVFANGLGSEMPPPGGWPDLAWFVPFAVLLCAAGPPVRREVSAFPALLAAGVGPIVLDLLLRDALPSRPAAAVVTSCTVLLVAAAALRLRWQVDVDRRTRQEARLRAEESERAGRLTALASLVSAAVGELEDQLEEVVRRARAAAVAVPDKGEQMLQQARRARAIVRDLANAFWLVPSGPKRDLDVAALVEEVVETALDEGLPLHVSLEDMARLPPVHADPRALSAALAHLLRNAAQASPGGVLRIRGSQREGEVELRFADDGPGVPPALRAEIFDPFFTTRPVGQAVGLGLTLVHFVARGHDGSIVLEESIAGACFVLRLPARPAAADGVTRTPWPFAAAALATGAIAIVLGVEVMPDRRAAWSVGFQIASALAAAAGAGWAAWRHRRSRRAFWAWIAAGALLWALTRALRVMEGGVTGRPGAGVWHLVLYALADLCWAAALLLRPDRRRDRPSARLGLSAGAVLCLFAYAHAQLVVLPDHFALTDPVMRRQLVIVNALQKLALAVWAAVLSWRALAPYWRGFYARLSAVLAAWTVGQTLAFSQRSRPDYVAGGASDLGWIVPFLCLGALAVREAAAIDATDDAPALLDRVRPAGSAAWLAAVAAMVAADALFGTSSGYTALDVARGRLTQVMVVVMALILAAREALAARENGPSWHGRFPRDAGPSRWARRMGSAVHELGAHLSSINALSRLLLSQSDASTRVRADTLRLQGRAEAATRVVKNLLSALPSSVGGRERLSANQVVEDAVEARRPGLEADGIRLTCSLAPEVPAIPLDGAALRHVVVALLDRAGLAVRGSGLPGEVEVTTAVRAGAVLVTVGDNGVAPPGAVVDRLMDAILDAPEPGVDSHLERSLVRESIERGGGSLAVGHRPGGGTEFVVRLPIPSTPRSLAAADEDPSPRARSGTS